MFRYDVCRKVSANGIRRIYFRNQESIESNLVRERGLQNAREFLKTKEYISMKKDIPIRKIKIL